MSKIATRSAYGKTLAQLVLENKDIVVLDADLTKSTKTCDAKQVCPERHFNVGIAEANMMGMAAGLAASDKIVFASTFAIFAAGRAYEQIRNSIAYPNLNVKICATHAGISVGEDGATHQAIEDIALMRSIPNMQVFSPCDANQTKAIIETIAKTTTPCYVRLGRLDVEAVYPETYTFEIGKGTILKKGNTVAVITTGLLVQEVLQVASILETKGIYITVVDMPSIKPIDTALIQSLAQKHALLCTCEEHSIIGGLGSAVCEVVSETSPVLVKRIGMNDTFGQSGKAQALLSYYKLDCDCLVKQFESMFRALK